MTDGISSSHSIPVDPSERRSREASCSAFALPDADAAGEEDGSVFMHATSTRSRGSVAVAVRRHQPHSELRIVIPPAPQSPLDKIIECSSDEPPTAPQTATVPRSWPPLLSADSPPCTPRHYRHAHAHTHTYGRSTSATGAVPRTPRRSPVENVLPYDPNVAAAVHQFMTQKSAVALLQVGISGRALVATPRRRRRRQQQQQGSCAGASRTSPPSDSVNPTPAHVELPGPQSRFPSASAGGGRFSMESLAQIFQSRSKARAKNTSTWPPPDDVELMASAVSGNGARAKTASAVTGAGAGAASSDAAERQPPVLSSGQAATITAAGGTGSRQDDGVADKPAAPVVDATTADGGQADIGMDRVLEEAASVQGLRLTWLLYIMIGLVIVLFILVFLLISFSTNRTIRVAGNNMLQSLAVSATSTMEIFRYDLSQLFSFVDSTRNYYGSDLTQELLCSRVSGAAIAIVLYDDTGNTTWTIVCDESRLSDAGVPAQLPPGCIASPGVPRLVAHNDYVVAAYRTLAGPASTGTLVVFLGKTVVGNVLYSNFLPQYSTATLQSLYLGIVLPTWDSATASVVMTTLTADIASYRHRLPTPLSESLDNVFTGICGSGSSKYVWHSVVYDDQLEFEQDALAPPVELGRPSKSSTTHDFPPPYTEHKGTWGIASRMALCTAVCGDSTADTCSPSNPTTVWLAIDSTLDVLRRDSALNVVGAISIVAVVLFCGILLLVYIGVSVPVHFLRYQLLRTVGSNKERSSCDQRIFRLTRRFWISDLVSLVRAVHILSICFRLNKKYVPRHILRDHAKQLYRYKGRVALMEADFDELVGTASDEDEEGSNSSNDHGGASPRINAEHLDNISEFVATTNTLRREISQHIAAAGAVHAVSRHEGSDGAMGTSMHMAGVEHLQPAWLVAVNGGGNGTGGVGQSPTPTGAGRAGGVDGRRETTHNGSGFAEEYPARTQVSLGVQDFLAAEASVDLTGDPSALSAAVPFTVSKRQAMEVRRSGEATMLCVRIGDVDSAYLLDYRVAAKQHKRIMRFLLRHVRQYKGAIFYRTGECLGAAWNAFDSCYNHAEYAAACAQGIANAFAPYKEKGLQVGIVLHQGTFVCGTVEDTKEAFVTAFGEGPRQAVVLAELAAVQPAINILITESVKQALSAKYECLIVDVVHFPELIHYLILFELGSPRVSSPISTTDVRSPMSSGLVVQYAKAFSLFRNHEFKAAVDGVQSIRQNFMCTMQVERLLLRLEILSNYYQSKDVALPMPYSRTYPTWANYELVASVHGVPDASVSGSSDVNRLSPMQDDAYPIPIVSPTSPGTRATRGSHLEDGRSSDTVATSALATNGAAGTVGTSTATPFALPEVLYNRVMGLSEEDNFKRELHDNVKRLGIPGQKSPILAPRRAGTGAIVTSSAGHTPYTEAQSTPKTLEASADGGLPLPMLLPPPATAHSGSGSGSSGEHPSRPAGNPSHTHANVSQSEVTSLSHTAAMAMPPPPLTGLGPALPTSPVLGNQDAGEVLPPARAARAASRHGDPAADGAAGDGPLAGALVALPLALGRAEEAASPIGASESSQQRAAAPAVAQDPCDTLSFSQRCFSFTHNGGSNPPVPLDPSLPHRAEEGEASTMPVQLGSFVSVASESTPADANGNSLIQSVGISLADPDGHFHSMSFAPAELPMQIEGKNGTTYMRSARVLGRGSFGSVYLGMDVHSGKLVAIKFLPLPSDDSEVGAVEAEVVIMQRVKDSHVVEFVTYAFVGTSIVLVMECMMAGSLQNMISAFKAIPSATAHVFLRDVLRGLNKLHSMGVIHRDVKPQNVLLTLAGNCKISDFGASAWLHELVRKEAQGQVLGTPVYLAPEAARGKPEEASDIWSCGIMFLQLITGRLPYPQEQLSLPAPILVYQIGIGGAVPIIPDNLNELDEMFVRACLQTDPRNRNPARNLLQMPLFTL